MDKESRDTIRNRIDEGGNFADILAEICFSKTELRTLLDLADERDRYREAVKQAYVDGHHDGYCDAPIMWPGWDEDRAKESWEQSDVKAALEGNTNE